MKWFKEYKNSLKNIDAEEPLDIYFFRPLAFVIVKLFYSFPFTPNHYSLFALISGIISAWFFLQGTEESFRMGALGFFLFAIFDCCDGMVARLKKNGTEFGRLIDGVVDYIVNLAVYISLAIGALKLWPDSGWAPFILVFLSGVSKAIHSFVYDHYLTEYLAYARGDGGFVMREISEIRHKLEKAIANKDSSLRIGALKLYLGYSSLQAGKDERELKYNPETYCKYNQKVLKMWSLIGPAVHIVFLIVAFLAKTPSVLYFYAIVFGNVWLLFMFFYQKHMNSILCSARQSPV